MDLIQLPKHISEEYEELCLQSAVLRLSWIHDGMWTAELDEQPSVVDDRLVKGKALECRSRGLDVLITLTRGLLAFGFRLQQDATNAEKALWDTASRDIGWDLKEDWKAKLELAKQIWPKMKLDKRFLEEKCTVEKLLNSPELKGLFRRRDDFRLFGRKGIFEYHDETSERVQMIDTDLLTQDPNDSDNWWDGNDPLTEYILNMMQAFPASTNELVDGETVAGTFHPSGNSPKFIRVLYKPRPDLVPRGFSGGLLTFKAMVPAIWAPGNMDESSAYEYGLQRERYNLCAVVRLGTDKLPDDVRLYWKDMSVIEPTENGNISEKSLLQERDQWSVEEHGHEFMLFYYRVAVPAGWEASEEVLKPQEFIGPKKAQPPPSAPTGPKPKKTVPTPGSRVSGRGGRQVQLPRGGSVNSGVANRQNSNLQQAPRDSMAPAAGSSQQNRPQRSRNPGLESRDNANRAPLGQRSMGGSAPPERQRGGGRRQ